MGGDSNHIDQSNTVFEAHYTESNHAQPQPDLTIQTLPGKPFDTYGPPAQALSDGPYPASLRQQGAKGLLAPSGQYGVPPGSQYGAPPRHIPGLPLGYGQHSGGGHSGGSTPRHPIKFRESVPSGLFSHVAHTTQHKDAHFIDHGHHGPTYLPPPIRDIKDVNSQTGSVSISIEPTSLYSLPHSGNPISFQQVQQTPSNLYGSPYDSYSAPLLTVGVGDHVTSGSNTNAVTSTIDGTLIANLSNLDAAAILKHCPYHEAILKAAQNGEKIPADLATSYVNSLSSLGTTLNKSSNTVTIPDAFLQSTSNSKRESYNVQKSKSLKEKHAIKDERLQYVSDQIQKTSERIRDLNEEAKQLQQKIVSTSQNIRSDAQSSPSQVGSYSVQIQSSNGGKSSVPHDQLLSGDLLQSILQAIDDPSKPQQQFTQQQVQQQQFSQQQQNVQQQQQNQQQQFTNQQQQIQQQQITQQQAQQLPQQQQQQLSQHQFTQTQQQQFAQRQHSFAQQTQQQLSQQQLPNDKYQNKFNANVNLESFSDGLVLPAGYEPVDHTKTGDQATQGSQHVAHTHAHKCQHNTAASSQSEVALPPPADMATIDKDDNDVAIYFGDKSAGVAETSAATGVSEG